MTTAIDLASYEATHKMSKEGVSARIKLGEIIISKLNISLIIKSILHRYLEERAHLYGDQCFCDLAYSLAEQEHWSEQEEYDAGRKLIEEIGYANAEQKLALAVAAFPAFCYLFTEEEMPNLRQSCGRF